jgi:hypothetical protein
VTSSRVLPSASLRSRNPCPMPSSPRFLPNTASTRPSSVCSFTASVQCPFIPFNIVLTSFSVLCHVQGCLHRARRRHVPDRRVHHPERGQRPPGQVGSSADRHHRVFRLRLHCARHRPPPARLARRVHSRPWFVPFVFCDQLSP